MRILLAIALIGFGSACASSPGAKDGQAAEGKQPDPNMKEADRTAPKGKLRGLASQGKGSQGRGCSPDPASPGNRVREDCIVPLAKMPVDSQPVATPHEAKEPPQP